MNGEHMISSIRPGHPRLFLSADWLTTLNSKKNKDRFLFSLINHIQYEADRIIESEPVPFRITGPRMLHNCQQILHRITTLGLIYLISKEKKYLLRTLLEIHTAAHYPHWNPDHFLDTAELCTAFGIAYDWLHNEFSEVELADVRTALIDKGLEPGLQAYKKNFWWVDNRFNWNTVCHGGLLIGSLAVADERPELAENILSTALKKIPLSLVNYGPDGAWQAGPDYWCYTTWYAALITAALQSACGHDFDLLQTPGLEKAGLFPVQCTGPTNMYFNFADAAVEAGSQPSFFWLAKQFRHSRLIYENHSLLKMEISAGTPVNPFNLVWYEPLNSPEPDLPKITCFKGPETVFMRSGWNDPMAFFIGFKGGFNQADHGHLDLGSFIFDAFGTRWAHDPGRDNYDLPGYWDNKEGGDRWKIFRLNNRSHNTLTLNDDIQRAEATATIIKTCSSENKYFAVADLSEAYHPHTWQVRRGIALIDNASMMIQDEILWASTEKFLQWQMMTDAEIILQGTKAILKKKNDVLTARILSPSGACFSVMPVNRPEPENSNMGFQQLIIKFKADEKNTIICVVIGAEFRDKRIIRLEDW